MGVSPQFTFHQQCTSVLISSHPHQHSLSFFYNCHPSRCKVIFYFVFTCIPLMMASDAEHFSMSLLAIWIFSLGKKIYPDPLSSFLSACLWTSLMAQLVKCLSTMRKTWVPSLGQEDSLEKEMATNSSTLA